MVVYSMHSCIQTNKQPQRKEIEIHTFLEDCGIAGPPPPAVLNCRKPTLAPDFNLLLRTSFTRFLDIPAAIRFNTINPKPQLKKKGSCFLLVVVAAAAVLFFFFLGGERDWNGEKSWVFFLGVFGDSEMVMLWNFWGWKRVESGELFAAT